MAIFYEDRVNELKLWKRNTLSFLPHFHDSIEVVYMLDGHACAIINGEEYCLKKGNVCISLPNVIHSYDNESNVDAFLFIIPRLYAATFSSLLDKNIVSTPVFSDDDEVLLSLVKTIVNTSKEKPRFKEQRLIGYFSVFFAEVFERTGLTEHQKNAPETERRILSYCLENFKHDISLELLANEIGISKSHISYIFSSKLKVCLPDFIGSLRVAEAKRLIKNGANMTDAAFGSGFASIRTFNRRFLSETGITPREYAKHIKDDTF